MPAEEWQNFVYSGNITSLCATSTTMWIGTEGGVVALDQTTGQLTHYTRADGLVALYAAQLGIDVEGSLWAVGQFSDLAQFMGTRWMSVPPPIHGIHSRPLATGFAIDQEGVKWLAAQGGVLRFDGEGWITLDLDSSRISSNKVNSIALDFLGNRWIATWEGLSVLMAGPLANHYPQDPQVSADWQTALLGEALTFSATADDPDGDALGFRFMWPDGATSEWSAYAQEMSFATAGTYQLRASAKDSKKAVSRWSPPLTIAVMDEYAPFVAVSTNREEYHPGQTLSVTVYVENRGEAKQVEAFMGVQLPDGTRLFYPDYSTTRLTFELSLHTGFKFGPFFFCELQVGEALVPGRYTFFTAVLDAATGETISESEAVFELLGLGPL